MHAPDESDEADYDDEELDAGVEALAEQFGPALALDALAGGDILKYSAVLAMDADTALLKLKLLGAQGAYQRRLHKMYHAKKE